MRAFFKYLCCKVDPFVLGFGLGTLLILPLLAVLSLSGCNSVQSVGVTGSYGNDIIAVSVTITFKTAPSAETVAALEKANAVRIKSEPKEVWAIGRYRVEDKIKVQAVGAALKDGGVIERIDKCGS